MTDQDNWCSEYEQDKAMIEYIKEVIRVNAALCNRQATDADVKAFLDRCTLHIAGEIPPGLPASVKIGD